MRSRRHLHSTPVSLVLLKCQQSLTHAHPFSIPEFFHWHILHVISMLCCCFFLFKLENLASHKMQQILKQVHGLASLRHTYISVEPLLKDTSAIRAPLY